MFFVSPFYLSFSQCLDSYSFVTIVIDSCKMVAYLLSPEEVQYSSSSADAEEKAVPTTLMNYLKKLPPPAVDLELRALCTHEGDEEGIQLLHALLLWLTRNAACGDNFEVLQAYIHRTLTIYMEMMIATPSLAAELVALKTAHAAANSRFRHLVQKNLCLLKLMGDLPIL
jgi:hypothetical protein